MKKKLSFLIFALMCCLYTWAQNFTKSYGAVSCQTSMGMQAAPAGLATYITFYDDYIYYFGVGKCMYTRTNYDGSIVYTPTTQGPPALRTTAILVSKDYSRMQQVQVSTMMGMSMQMVYNYQWIGDGSHAAENLLGSGGSYYGDDDDDDSPITCHSCQGSGSCKYCYGSGRNQYTRDGRCGVCRGTGRCSGCNGKGHY